MSGPGSVSRNLCSPIPRPCRPPRHANRGWHSAATAGVGLRGGRRKIIVNGRGGTGESIRQSVGKTKGPRCGNEATVMADFMRSGICLSVRVPLRNSDYCPARKFHSGIAPTKGIQSHQQRSPRTNQRSQSKAGFSVSSDWASVALCLISPVAATGRGGRMRAASGIDPPQTPGVLTKSSLIC